MRRNILSGAGNVDRSKTRGPGEALMSRLWLVLTGFVLAAGAWFVFARFYTDYLWFSSAGFQIVLGTMQTAGVVSAMIIGVVVGVLTFLNLRLAVGRCPEPLEKVYESDEGVRTTLSFAQPPPLSTIPRYAPIPAGIVVGLLAALTVWGLCEAFLRYLYQVPFGSADPIFGYGIAFYVYTLPVMDRLSALLLTLLVVNLVGAVAVYLASTKTEVNKTTGKMSKFEFPQAGRGNILALSVVFSLLVAGQAILVMPNLMLMNDGSSSDASFTDVNAVSPLLWAQMATGVLAAIVTFVCIFRKGLGWLWTGVSVLALVWLAGFAYPAFAKRFSVAPNELGKETEFIRHNIEATRTSYAIDNVEEHELSGSQTLTAPDIRENQRTISNIRLWDTQSLPNTCAQIREIRTYHEFRSVDNDRYQINGAMQQVMIGPRELNVANLLTAESEVVQIHNVRERLLVPC